MLENQRQEWESSLAGAPQYFHIRYLKGAWTLANKGVAYDAVGAYPSGKYPLAWARSYLPTASARFDIAAWGEDQAATMSKFWCAKMNHFYQIYVDQDDEKYVYTAADVQCFTVPEDFMTLMEKLPDGKNKQRAQAILALVPKC
eukprot:9892871-Karenia_brevis.AAC.1